MTELCLGMKYAHWGYWMTRNCRFITFLCSKESSKIKALTTQLRGSNCIGQQAQWRCAASESDVTLAWRNNLSKPCIWLFRALFATIHCSIMFSQISMKEINCFGFTLWKHVTFDIHQVVKGKVPSNLNLKFCFDKSHEPIFLSNSVSGLIL